MRQTWSKGLLALTLWLGGCGEWSEPIRGSMATVFAAQDVQTEVQSLFRELGVQPTDTEFQEAADLFAATLQQIPTGEATLPGPPSNGMPGLILRPDPQRNMTELLVDDNQIFPELLRLIGEARSRIQIDIYLLGGNIGMEVAQALVRRHKEGLPVELMIDPKFGLGGPTSTGIQRVVTYLKSEHLPFRLHPLERFGVMPNRLQSRLQIDHNKIVAIDGRTLLIGSMNFDDIARLNHDVMLKITGPAAQEASAMLAAEWPLGHDPESTLSTQALGLVRLTQTAPQQQSTKGVLLDLIRGAKKSVHVAMYEFADPEMAAALCEAHRRGLDVRVVLDPKGDNLDKYGVGFLPDGLPNLMPARELQRVGAPVRWFVSFKPQQEMHMKVMVVDGDTLAAGSTNWTPNAFRSFRETGVVIKGATGAKAEALFQSIWNQHSQPIPKLTIRQQVLARTVDFLNRNHLAFW